jgi:hypothetical protein
MILRLFSKTEEEIADKLDGTQTDAVAIVRKTTLQLGKQEINGLVGEVLDAGQSLLEVLGAERRDKVLSALYICRCDTSGQVKSAALGVWKALVASPRTLKDMVPTRRSLKTILKQGQQSAEHRLSSLLDKVSKSVAGNDLLLLRELINAASPDALEDYEDILISTVRVALVDNDDDVREAAAEAFDSLQQIMGKRVVIGGVSNVGMRLGRIILARVCSVRSVNRADNACSASSSFLNK